MTTSDVAIFLDLDNVTIGARDASLTFDVHLILNEIKLRTRGRIVFQRPIMTIYARTPRWCVS